MVTHVFRLVDHSIEAYHRIGELVDELIASQIHPRAIFRCSSAIEECVTTVNRAGRMAQRLMKLGIFDKAAIPSKAELLAVTQMRDAIEHIDERLLGHSSKSPNVAGAPAMVTPDDDAAVLGPHRLEWVTLASVITKLHHAVNYPIR